MWQFFTRMGVVGRVPLTTAFTKIGDECGIVANARVKVQALLEKGVGVHVQDQDGRTPLFIAVRNDHPGVVKLLLDGGAIPDIPDDQGRTAVTVAKELGNEAILRLLK